MSVASSTIAADDDFGRSDRIGRAIAIALATYLAIVSWPIARYVSASGATLPLFIHLAILGYTLALLASPVPLRRTAMDWLTLTIGPLMYVELRWIIAGVDRKSTRLNSSHSQISYAVFCLKKKKTRRNETYCGKS